MQFTPIRSLSTCIYVA